MNFTKTRIFTLILCFVLAGWAFTEDQPVETLEDLVRQLIGLQKEKVALENEWKEQKVMLQAETDLLLAEKGTLEKALGKQKREIEKVDSEVKELSVEKSHQNEKLASIEKTLTIYEKRLSTIFPQLPNFLQKKLKVSLNKLEQGKKPVAERLRLIVALLEEIELFDKSIHIGHVVLTCPDGNERQMEVLYLGLGAAFTVTDSSIKTSFAAKGKLDKGGWKWDWDEKIGPEVQKAIAIYKKEKNAQLVKLPLGVSK